MKNILIIGVNGFIGRRILNDLSKFSEYNIIGSSLHSDILVNKTTDYNFIQADIRDISAIRKLFKTVYPSVVINTSALSVPDYCELHHEEAYHTNVTAVAQLATLCQEYNSRFIHLSTDFVFNGKSDHLYTEEDLPAPVNYYGFTKWKGEEKVAEICNNYAIIRVAIVYGKTLLNQHGNIVELVINRLQKGKEIYVVSDQWRTPTHVGDVSKGIQHLINSDINGIFHICGNVCLTIAELAYQVAEYANLNSSLIRPIATKEMNEPTPRPCFSGMSIDKAFKKLNYQPCSIKDCIKEMLLQ